MSLWGCEGRKTGKGAIGNRSGSHIEAEPRRLGPFSCAGNNAELVYWRGGRRRDNGRERSFDTVFGPAMLEDEVLKLRFKLGSEAALRDIYEKYLDYMLSVAMAFLNDAHGAEDVVHDVFVSLARSADRFRLTGNLKHYLATCVANRARDRLRAGKRQAARLRAETSRPAEAKPPEAGLMCAERAQQVYAALAALPYEQREVIALRIKAGMKFKAIARHQGASYVAVQARYRRGIDRVRSILNGRL